MLQFLLAQIQEVLHCNGFDSLLSIALVATYVVLLYFPPQAGSSCDKAAREGGIKCGPLSSCFVHSDSVGDVITGGNSMTRLSRLIHIDLECRSAELHHRHLYTTPWHRGPCAVVNVKTAEALSAVISYTSQGVELIIN